MFCKQVFKVLGNLILLVIFCTGQVAAASNNGANEAIRNTSSSQVSSSSTFDCASVSEIPQEECNALLAFYNSTGGADWTNNSGWLNTNTPCSWYGLTCGNGTNVTVLSFSSNNLLGNIPTEIGNLTSLQGLFLKSNQLSGDIPAEISNLSLLTNLDIGYNMLSVSDPTLLTNLNTKDPDWAATQTIPPSNVLVVITTLTSIELSWTAIPYMGDGGYYEVGWATNIAGPYTIHGVTSDKTATSYVLSNILQGGNYYIRIRTYTPSHAMQQNGLWSEYTPPISAIVDNPVPVLNSILPDHKDAGDGGFDLILEGSNFTSDAKTLWNGVELVTTFSTSGRVSAAVPSLLLQSPGVVDVTVRNPAPGGGTSNALPFNVNPFTNSWMAHSPEGGVIWDIEIDRNNPSVMYAGTESGGVYKSVNGGQSWFAVNNGIQTTNGIISIAVAPSNSSIIMASGTWTYLSKNGGASWSRVSYKGTMSTDGIKFDAQDPNIIILGTPFGLERTEDGGITWQDIGKFPEQYIRAVEVDQQNQGTIYEVGTIQNSTTSVVWKTTDGGTSWNQLTGLPDSIIGRLRIDPSNSNILYAATMYYGALTGYGIYKSVDGGGTWAQVVSDNQYYTDIVINSSDPNQVYVASDNGVYRTSDGGLNWDFNASRKNRDVLTLAIVQTSPSVLFGAGFHGVFKSLDSGVTWSPVNTGLYTQKIVDLAYSSDSNTLFAATFQGGIWNSTDYGASWNHIDHDMPFLSNLRMDPNNTDHLFVYSGGFLESTDGGQTWASRSFPYSFSFLTFAANSDLFAAASDGADGTEHVYKSVDNGNTWVEKSDILPACANTCRINFLVADPLDPNVSYVTVYTFEDRDPVSGQHYYLYKTSNGGESWARSDNGINLDSSTEILALTIDPIDTSVLYISTGFEIFKSVDGGGHWVKASTGLPLLGAKVTIAVDKTNNQIIYTGGEGGVYRSMDGGATWMPFNYGLNVGWVWSILPIPTPPPAAASARLNAQAAGQNSVNRVFSVAGGQVYAYFMINNDAPPSVNSILRVSASPTSVSTVNFTVKFSKPVTGVDTTLPFDDFALTTTGGISGASITSVSGSGSVYTVTVNRGSGVGTIRLDVVDDNSIVDAAGNLLGGAAVGDGNFTSGETYSISSFGDVSTSHWAWKWIESFYQQGITTGCAQTPVRSYCPENNVTRAEMAVFVERALHGGSYQPPVVPLTFNDINGHWAQYWIERFKSEGITTGCGGGKYCPDQNVTRAEMSVFILRALHGGSYQPPVVGLTFNDTTGHWAQYWIEQFKTEGITTGCGGGKYCPDQNVTRAEMAVFIVRAFGYPVLP